MRTRALLFDLDGTLLDSLSDIGESMNIVLQDMGLSPHSLMDYRAFVGDGITMLARRALPPSRRDDATVEACVASMRRVYASHAARKTKPYEGIEALLDGLAARGLPMAVLSNKPHEQTVELVRLLLRRWRFAAVFGERASVPRKPDPAAAIEIASLLPLPPPSILYVGDTPTDLATAEAAGMPGVAVTWGFRSEEELVEAGARSIARQPADVLAFLR